MSNLNVTESMRAFSYTINPMNAVYDWITLNMDWVASGISANVNCNFPTTPLEWSMNVTNSYFYNTNAFLPLPGAGPVLFLGTMNSTVSNNTFEC